MKPVVGILVDRPPAEAFVSALAELRRWCRPLTAGDTTPAPVAWIATSPAAAARMRAPCAAWIESADEPEGSNAAAFLTADPAVADVVGARAIVVGGPIDTTTIPVVGPFVRARQRRAHGLPARFIVEVGEDGNARSGDSNIPPNLVGSALCLASAAIVRGGSLLDGMSRGAPCITDPGSATGAGAVDDIHAVVVDDGDALAAAMALADDELRAARLSAAARELVERRHDGAAAARRIATALGLTAASPADRLTLLLDDLGTPPTAAVRQRVLSLALVS